MSNSKGHKPTKTKCVHDKSLIRIRVSYFCVIQMIIRELKAAGITSNEVLQSLPQELSSTLILLKNSTIDELFAPESLLSRHLHWKNLTLLAAFVNLCASPPCYKAFQEYSIKVATYNIEQGGQIVAADNGIAILHSSTDPPFHNIDAISVLPT